MGHDHPHEHDHDEGHAHGDVDERRDAGHKHGTFGRGHSHDHGQMGDLLAEGSAEGIRALKVSTAGLGLTALIQFVVVAIGGSVALMADALHNLGDVFTTVALWIAFVATRRAANNRYTFGYQRFEDLAGLVIIVAIFASAGLALYEGIAHLVKGSTPTHLAAGIAAGFVGVIGNEAVAQVKIRAGRRIGSPSLVAEGQHSRVDGIASLGAVVGIGGVALGLDWTDPVAGIAIALVIVYIGYDSGRPILARLVDRVDPEIVERLMREAASVEEVLEVHDVRARWAGRALYVIMHVSVAAAMPLERAHAVGEQVRHAVLHAVPQVVEVDIHLDPFGAHSVHHAETAHHFPGRAEP